MQNITRMRFDINTSSTVTDTGPAVMGELVQTRWERTSATQDTGGDLQIFAQQREADTGDDLLVVNDNDCLGVDFQRAYRQPLYNSSGVLLDTGDDWTVGGLYFANERPRVRVIPAGNAVQGKLYLWFKS
jgi:hypothetical protein